MVLRMLTEMTDPPPGGLSAVLNSDSARNEHVTGNNLQCNGAVTINQSGAKHDQVTGLNSVSYAANGHVNGHVSGGRKRNDSSVCTDDTAVLNMKDLLKKRENAIIEDGKHSTV